jgi:hypothetical protein
MAAIDGGARILAGRHLFSALTTRTFHHMSAQTQEESFETIGG